MIPTPATGCVVRDSDLNIMDSRAILKADRWSDMRILLWACGPTRVLIK